jgi:hypothetical protein
MDLTIDHADAIQKRKPFQKTLEEATTAYYTELESSKEVSKNLIIGKGWPLPRSSHKKANLTRPAIRC